MSDEDNIQISRSDGRHHAINPTVFAAMNMGSGKSTSTNSSGTSSADHSKHKGSHHHSHHNHHHEHAHINIKRSDGAAHDINEMMKAHTATIDREREASCGDTRQVSVGRHLSAGGGEGSENLSSLLESHYPSHVRIVHMSDTHNFLRRGVESCVLPPGDILAHTGDFTNGGTVQEFAQFNEWLGSVSYKYHYRIICLGSRDVKVFKDNWAKMTSMLTNATHVLCHTEACVLGIRFYGCPWNWGHLSNYSVRSGAPGSTNGGFQNIPEGVDVVLTHVPANGRLDFSGANLSEHWGSKDLGEALRRIKPGLHLHGHSKDCRGTLPAFGNAPLTLNSCMSNRGETVLYGAPQVVQATNQRMQSASKDLNVSGHNWTFNLDFLIPPADA